MQKYLIALVAAGLIIGGGVWFAKSGKNTETAGLTGTENNSQNETSERVAFGENGEFEGSIFALASTGQAYRCTTSVTAQGVTSSGVVFVSGDNIRGDFESVVPVVGKVTAHMIADKTHVYSWTSLSSQGVRSQKTADAQPDGASTQSFDPRAPYSYNCVPQASVDASLFARPGNVNFQEYN